jgi:hypothetical protein
MKPWFSPLFIASSLLFVYALYLIVERLFNPQSFSILIAVPMVCIAATGMVVHFLFSRILVGKVRVQLLVEAALILSIVVLLLIR